MARSVINNLLRRGLPALAFAALPLLATTALSVSAPLSAFGGRPVRFRFAVRGGDGETICSEGWHSGRRQLMISWAGNRGRGKVRVLPGSPPLIRHHICGVYRGWVTIRSFMP